MDLQFAALTRSLNNMPSRRDLLRGLAAAGLGWGVGRLPESADARKKRKKRRKKNEAPTGPLCTRIGEPCSIPGSDCQEQFCLHTPFTITATWQGAANHDTWLYVPPGNGVTGPRPQIDYDCNQTNSPCAEQYPFACVNADASGPGDEITTIYELLPGLYEYWLALEAAPAGELTVVLTDRGGRVVRTWSSPAVTSTLDGSWHVFDIDGENRRVTSIDAPPQTFPLPVTNVCPA